MKIKLHSASILLLTALFMGLYSCQFNKSVEKNLNSGAFISGNGLTTDEVIIKTDNKAEDRNDFFYGEKVNFVFENVNGFTKEDGKVFPGMSMYIIQNEKDTVFSNPDILKNYDKGTDLSPLELTAFFTAALAFKNEEKYKLLITIWDKKGKGTLKYELEFLVKESNLLTIKSNGLNYSNIYLWNETLQKPVFDTNINADDLYILILDGVEGLEPIEDKVFPIFALDLSDSEGNKIISSTNILSSIENQGASAEDLKKQVYAKISFTEGSFANPCKLFARLKDKNSSKEIVIEGELIIN